MKIGLNWLKDYIAFDYTVEELANSLTMVGLEVEDIQQGQSDFQDVVVGKVTRVEKHSSTDTLSVCQVDIGKTILTVICGAPNVSENQLVPVAKVGAILSEGVRIESKSIRGVQSEGMICSERELGISDHHDGILVLDKKDYTVGELFFPQAGQNDSALNINVTPNRPDCLSHIGVAREVGVILGEAFSKPEVVVKESTESIDDCISIEILDSVGCPRYSARVVYDVTVGPSPEWLKHRLESVGVRSINNVVDVTNYVLMETGQPLHGFDNDLIQGQKIIVRKAKPGEIFTTLDGENRSLMSEDLLICDGERPVALAGVMGGLNSEVSDHTQRILLESAYFDPMTIRRTAKRLGMSTEASQRFERGTDPNNTINAVNRAAQLLSEIAGGKVMEGVVDVYPQPVQMWEVSLRPSRITKVLGTEIPRENVLEILHFLGLEIRGENPLLVTVPTFRPDLTREIDLIEEIVRHYGYEKIPAQLYSKMTLSYESNQEQNVTERMRDIFVGMGFLETMNNSMVSKEHISFITPNIPPVKVQNPLNPETVFLRTSLLGGLLDSVHWNKNHYENNLRLFEIGRIFRAKGKMLPDEVDSIAGILTGSLRSKPFWGESERTIDFFHLKGALETFQEGLHIEGFEFKPERYDALKPETSMKIVCRNEQIGFMGEIRNEILEQWDIVNQIFAFEIVLNDLNEKCPQMLKFRPIPRFPSIKRDLSVVVKKEIPIGSLKDLIHQVGGEHLVSVEIFDVYQGHQIPSGKKSVALSLTFLSLNRTLKEKEVDPVMSAVIKALETSYSASLRS